MSEEILYEMNDQMYPKYKLKVIKDSCGGLLTVTFNDRVFHEQQVPLSYGAQYGVDGFDIEAWGLIACQVVDEHRAKHERD